jgi:peptidoglycan biosynthesis protein MviN/MurJ (putative lipid II flippase)
MWGWLPHSALALATAIAALIEAGMLLWLIQSRLGNQDTQSLWQTGWRVFLAALCMAGVLAVWRLYAPDSPLIQVVIAVPLGLVVYLGLAAALGVKELWLVVHMLLHKSPDT